ncbi:hypothetical protein LTR53_003571 [Teratosphaeriaceae sp. CCFEE 6253]|nr:hypothetical protein LTR53_003571 [Teratosphaeriaceae sp. CCFEE 6253]
MDPSNGAYSRTQNIPGGRAFEPSRPSVDSQRLQKKRSHPGVRNASQPLPSINAGVRSYGDYSGRPDGAGEQARKSSLRNVVRRIFGRRSKEVSPQPLQRSPPRHAYHYSEPAALLIHAEEVEPRQEEHVTPHRTLSAPLQQLPSPSFSRTRSPFAVQFPQSARLKPLPLGDPFYAPGSQLRRRKTSPSLLVTDKQDDDAIAASPEEPPLPSFEAPRETPLLYGLGRQSTLRSAKRRSRSADDLQRAVVERSPPRERSEDIRYWRESFQGSVLRASGFRSKEPAVDLSPEREIRAEDRTPLARLNDPFESRQSRSGTFQSSPPVRHGPTFSEADIGSASGYGTGLSRDLEDRVAKLEAGLQHFQQSLSRLTAERNQRTVLVGGGGGGLPQRRQSTDARTPSMLADTLAHPLALASLQYEIGEAERPATSPQPPRTPVREASARRQPAVPRLPFPEYHGAAEPFSTPPLPQHETAFTAAAPRQRSTSSATAGNSTGTGPAQAPPPPQHTFRSLYEMLADERAARRRLETQLHRVRRDLTALHDQVAVSSGVPSSQRSSLRALDHSMVGSSRLRDLLRETERSPPSAAAAAAARDSGATAFSGSTGSAPPGAISRFSNSESEAGALAESTEDLALPYDTHRMPVEGEPSGFRQRGAGGAARLRGARGGGEGEMF